jgi:hypothetical protein
VACWALHVNYSNLWSQMPPLQTAAGIRQGKVRSRDTNHDP